MNYQTVYNNLIEKARQRNGVNGYSEQHHIIPRSVGGTDDSNNLVQLTAREHFIAHLLLAKIHGGALIFAAYAMCHQYNKYQKRTYKINSHIYNTLKKEAAKILSEKAKHRFSGVPKTAEHKEKIRNALVGKTNSHLGEKKSQLHKNKIVASRKNNGNEWHSDETKRKISESAKIVVPIMCPHCNKIGSPSNMKRWHFDKCHSNL